MDYEGGDHQTADQGCIWLFGCRSKSVGAGLGHGLYAKALMQLQYAACGVI